jgi:hypothetical protein
LKYFKSVLNVYFSVLNVVPLEDDALGTETFWGVCKKLAYWVVVHVYELVVLYTSFYISDQTVFLTQFAFRLWACSCKKNTANAPHT